MGIEPDEIWRELDRREQLLRNRGEAAEEARAAPQTGTPAAAGGRGAAALTSRHIFGNPGRLRIPGRV